MNVTTATTIYDLANAYPYVLDWLAGYDAHFDNLRNPALFNTMARVATIGHAAEMAGRAPDEMLDAIRTEIARHEILAEEAADAPGATVDPEAAAARQEALKSIIRKLHDGEPVEQVKAEFDQLIAGIDSAEIARMEQALIADGMPVEDVQRLCDVHVTVFKEALDSKPSAVVEEGHPLDSYQRENAVATELVADLNLSLAELSTAQDVDARAALLAQVSAGLEQLAQIDIHFARKENQLFPPLEKHGVEGPTKVMWALDDDIRGRIKSARALLAAGDAVSAAATLPETLKMVDDMVYKEEKILFPTALSVLTADEWAAMAAGDAQIGYAWAEGPAGDAARDSAAVPVFSAQGAAAGPSGELLLPLPTGALTLAQLDLLFRVLPFDVTYVDENDQVRFYSEGERVFPRSPGVIGRQVRNCHPPKSLAKVEAILAAFRAGEKDTAEFWIELGPKFVHIRYIALRDQAGAYKGCLEVVQDATHVRGLEGQRRIAEWS